MIFQSDGGRHDSGPEGGRTFFLISDAPRIGGVFGTKTCGFQNARWVMCLCPESGGHLLGHIHPLPSLVVQADSSAEAALKEAPELTATFKELLTTADYNTAFMDLEQGAVDVIAMDVIVAGYQIQQRNADFKILDDSLSEEEYGVGFKKGNTELRDKVQSTLEEMAEDGTLQEVSEKWFSKDVTTIGK